MSKSNIYNLRKSYWSSEEGLLDVSIEVLITQREGEILNSLSKGFTTKETANQLHISSYTVESHKKNLQQKLRARNVTHMVAISMASGII